MEKIEYKITTIEQKTPYIIRTYCDRCGKLIFKHFKQMGDSFRNEYKKIPYADRLCVGYYEVRTGHNDWGNDSIDSVEHKIICRNCLTKEYADYVERASEGINTEYIEMEHENTYSLPFDESEEKE